MGRCSPLFLIPWCLYVSLHNIFVVSKFVVVDPSSIGFPKSSMPPVPVFSLRLDLRSSRPPTFSTGVGVTRFPLVSSMWTSSLIYLLNGETIHLRVYTCFNPTRLQDHKLSTISILIISGHHVHLDGRCTLLTPGPVEVD